MAFLNDGTQIWSYAGDIQLSSQALIAMSERRLEQKKQAIEDLKNEYNLLEEQAFKTYKRHIRYDSLRPQFIDYARDWFRMAKDGVDKNGKKLDGRRHYEEKDMYDYFVGQLQTFLGINDMEITEMCDYNFGEAINIFFKSCGHEWILKIPLVDDIKIMAYQHSGGTCFKLTLSHKDSSHMYSHVGATFIEEELAEIMSKYLHSTTKEESQC